MTSETQIRRAEFSPKVCFYWLLSGAVVMLFTVVGIPLLPIWFLIGFFVTKKYLDSMECVLTDKALKVKKGILVRVEKTIPLEKITDMGMVQGPIMRAFDLQTLTVETAGQSGTGSLVSLTGIVDAKGFRETVLQQREATAPSAGDAASTAAMPSDTNALLGEIKDSLLRIESTMKSKQD